MGSLWLGLCLEARQLCPSHRAQGERVDHRWHWANGNDVHALGGRILGAVHTCLPINPLHEKIKIYFTKGLTDEVQSSGKPWASPKTAHSQF